MWFAVEVISHLNNSTSMSQFYTEPTTVETEICAVVTISDRPNVPLSPMYKNIKKYNQSYSPEYTVYETEEPFTGIIIQFDITLSNNIICKFKTIKPLCTNVWNRIFLDKFLECNSVEII